MLALIAPKTVLVKAPASAAARYVECLRKLLRKSSRAVVAGNPASMVCEYARMVVVHGATVELGADGLQPLRRRSPEGQALVAVRQERDRRPGIGFCSMGALQ